MGFSCGEFLRSRCGQFMKLLMVDTRPCFLACRFASDMTFRGHVVRYYRTSPDQRTCTNSDAGENHAASANRATIFQHWRLGVVAGVASTWVAVIGKGHV